VSEPAIRTAELEKSYFGVPALEPIDLEVPEGQRVTLIGHNGSGKTTLLKILAGTLESTGGRATVMGHPLGAPDARATLSFLTDQPVFYDDLTVWEHLEYVARLHHTVDWEEHAVDLLDRFAISDRADDLPATFSRGLKQKAAIAIAFVRPFDVVLVDEPFIGLDRAGREALLELFDDVHADGATLVVATHELSSADRAERLLALREGTLIYDGPPNAANLPDLVG
jgi:ABC-type multidrug transport system ATPase subunit